jgi:hypothetical protein
MKIIKSLSDDKLIGYKPKFFEDFVCSEDFKSRFCADYWSPGIKQLGLKGFVLQENYQYYCWSDTGKLFAIIGPLGDPRRGWMACAFKVEHPDPKSLSIYQAMMNARSDGNWTIPPCKTKKELISALEAGTARWKRTSYNEAKHNQWIK